MDSSPVRSPTRTGFRAGAPGATQTGRKPHVAGFLTTLLIHGGIIAAILVFSYARSAGSDGPKLTDMVTIEAALAYKATPTKTKQPQKPPRRAAPPPVKAPPEGVSRDAEQAPVETKPDQPPTPAQPKDDLLAEFERLKQLRQSTEEEDELLPVDDVSQEGGGEFDGSQHGFATVSKGDPYMQGLAADVFEAWEVPTLEQGKGTATGCVRLGEDGRIIDTQLLEPTQNANIDRSVRLALKKLQELRESGKKPVPRHLMDVTSQWTCFKFSV